MVNTTLNTIYALLLKACSISEIVCGMKEKEHISMKPIASIWISENTRDWKEK